MMLCDCYAIEPDYEDGDLGGLYFIWPYVPVNTLISLGTLGGAI